MKEAESHTEEDKKKKDLIEARNQADSMAYSVEKNIKEFGDKIDAAEKTKIEEAIAKVKTAMESDDTDAIKAAQEELTQSSHKLAEAMYAKTAEEQTGAGAGTTAGPEAEEGKAEAEKKDDDVVDADFEEVK